MKDLNIDKYINNLIKLSKEENYLNAVLSIIVEDVKKPVYDAVNENETIYLLGLWIKSLSIQQQSTLNINQIIDNIKTNLDKIHIAYFSKFDPKNKILDDTSLLQESFFYFGSDAMDIQFLNIIVLKYKNYDTFLLDNFGFNTDDIKELYIAILTIIDLRARKFDLKPRQKDLTKIYEINPNNFFFKNNPRLIALLDLLSFEKIEPKNTDLRFFEDYNILFDKPIVKNRGIYFVPFPFLISKVMNDKIFEILWNYNRQSFERNKGRESEQAIEEMFVKYLKDTKVISNIVIEESKNNQYSEIDIAIIFKTQALICQIKSKKMTAKSRIGDIDKFKSDFKRAVSDAVEQNKKCKIAILNPKSYRFKLNDSDDVNFNNIDKIYTMSITTEGYGPIALHTDFQTEHDLPHVLTIYDLDTILKMIKHSSQFFQYLEFRNKHKNARAGSELDYFDLFLREENIPNVDRFRYQSELKYVEHFHLAERQQFINHKINLFLQNANKNSPCICGSGLKYKRCCCKVLVQIENTDNTF